jgi:hypothetical protein
MPSIGKIFIGLAALFGILGALFLAAERLFGRSGGFLPGDLVIRKGNFTFVFPIVTCIVLSVILTLLFRLFGGAGGPR